MPLISMTGFARVAGEHAGVTWAWELKSVNGKALDVRLRVPQGFEQLEAPTRAAIGAHVRRGSLQVNLSVQDEQAQGQLCINKDVLEQYVTLAEELRARLGSAPLSAENLLTMKGVIEHKTATRSEAQQAELDDAIMADLREAALQLANARKVEGAQLETIIAGQLQMIVDCHAAAKANPARQPEAIKARLKAQIAELMELTKLDETRLAQEAVLAFTKADVKEELDRLASHIAAAQDLMASKDAIGRKFDFLAQEFNREANTLCSKANDPSLTAIGLDLKTTIDQMREQVQNIE